MAKKKLIQIRISNLNKYGARLRSCNNLMARTKGSCNHLMARAGNNTEDDDSSGDEHCVKGEEHRVKVKQEPGGCSCNRKRSPPSPDEVRASYDFAAVHRSDALRALRSSRLAVDEAIRSLEHAASTAAKAFDAEADATNKTRSSLSKRQHRGEPANDRGQGGDGGGY